MVERIKAGGRAEAFIFPQAASYLSVGRGACRRRWSSPRPEERQGSYEESERGKKGGREFLGDERVFILGRESGWQMRPVSEVTGLLNWIA